jgi:hypothetical protein
MNRAADTRPMELALGDRRQFGIEARRFAAVPICFHERRSGAPGFAEAYAAKCTASLPIQAR